MDISFKPKYKTKTGCTGFDTITSFILITIAQVISTVIILKIAELISRIKEK